MEILDELTCNPDKLQAQQESCSFQTLALCNTLLQDFLSIAVEHNQKEMVEHFLRNLKSQNSPNAEGTTPLMIALKKGNTNIVKALLQHWHKQVKVILKETDYDDKNVLHYAFESQNPAEATQID